MLIFFNLRSVSLLLCLLLCANFAMGQNRQNREQEDNVRRLMKERQPVRTPAGWYHEPGGQGWLRKIISKVHLEVTPGYSRTFYTHNLEGLAVYSGVEGTRIFSPADYNAGTNSINSSLTTWYNTSQGTGNFGLSTGDYIVSSDSAKLKFRNTSIGIPFNVAAYIKIDRFRVGGGYWIQPEIIGKFTLLKFPEPDIIYDPGVGFTWLKKYYGMFGAEAMRFGDWVLTGDIRIGGWNPGKKFNRPLMKKSLFFNLGTGFEWDKAEYFKIYIRPSFEFRSYELQIPETSSSLRHRSNNVNLQIGAVIRLPEKRRCVLKKCQVQIDHMHGDKEYRTRMFPIWKRQNPNYGENYPRLIRYKRGNRNKKNPY